MTVRSDVAIPARVQSWYLVCRSAEVRPGAVVSREFLGRSLVLFRTASGSVHALEAHCAHMGTHLGKGVVVDDCIRCPLHHWEYDGQGLCRRIPNRERPTAKARQRVYPVAERYGAVFVFNGPEPLFPPPAFPKMAETEVRVAYGRPVPLACAWTALVSNAFDIQHLQTTHERLLREPPALDVLDRYRIRLRYVSRVIGRGAPDRVMRRLSRDHIAVTITCWGGPVLLVESDLGRVRSALLLGFMPTAEGTEITPCFVVRKTAFGPVDRLRAALAGWLYFGFLGRDVAIMDGMRFGPHLRPGEDEVLERYLEFLSALPPDSLMLEDAVVGVRNTPTVPAGRHQAY